MFNIILLDDQQLLRIALKNLLKNEFQGRIYEASSTEEAQELIDKDSNVNLLIMEILVPGGMEFIGRAMADANGTKVIVLSSEQDIHSVKLALSLGASAYLLKECLKSELSVAIECVTNGRKYICSGLAAEMVAEIGKSKVSPPKEKLELSSREREVMELIAKGMTNMEISDKLFLSKRTVEGHRQSLLIKTKTRNSAQLIGFACRHGLI